MIVKRDSIENQLQYKTTTKKIETIIGFNESILHLSRLTVWEINGADISGTPTHVFIANVIA